MTKLDWFSVVLAVGFTAGAVFGLIVFRDTFHADLCQERFSHAETVADTLAIIHDDTFCLDFSIIENSDQHWERGIG